MQEILGGPASQTGLTGGLLSVETDPVKAVDGMLSHIEANRHKLGI